MVTQSPIQQANNESIAIAADLLRAGKLVAFPTETVYGLGADATNDRAVAAIYEAKGRPTFNPLIVHAADPNKLDDIIVWNETAQLLASQFWPGPLTLVLPRRSHCKISLLVSAGMDTLAVRIPSHPVAQSLLCAFDRPIAAPSANKSGKLSPTTPLHVAQSFHDKIALILAGGKSKIGLESTVVNLATETPTILRPGAITKEQLVRLVPNIQDYGAQLDEASGSSMPRLAPGMLASHYAPSVALRLYATDVKDGEALLSFGSDFHIKGGLTRLNLSESGDLHEAAANLFSMLHALDKSEFKAIAVMPIPNQGLGVAINDRLLRASYRETPSN